MNEDRDYCEAREEEGENEMSIINAVYKCDFCEKETDLITKWAVTHQHSANITDYVYLCKECLDRCRGEV